MHFSALFIFTLAAGITAKSYNGTGPAGSEIAECKEISHLSKIIEIATNPAELDKLTKNNATKVAEIKAQAYGASIRLHVLKSNTTVVSYCTVLEAQAAERNQCEEIFMLQRFIRFATNSSDVATATRDNATKIAEVQQRASSAAAKLKTLTSNSTLQADCPAVEQEDECRAMNRLSKLVEVAHNPKELAAAAKGNATREREIKELAVVAETKLTVLKGNATFVAACKAIETPDSGKNTPTTQTLTTATPIARTGPVKARTVGFGEIISPPKIKPRRTNTVTARSGAVVVHVMSVEGVMASLIGVLAFGMFMF